MKREELRSLRFIRNSYLSKTDKFLISDYPVSQSDRDEITIYREELRNITNTVESIDKVEDVVWPTLPGFLRGKM